MINVKQRGKNRQHVTKLLNVRHCVYNKLKQIEEKRINGVLTNEQTECS